MQPSTVVAASVRPPSLKAMHVRRLPRPGSQRKDRGARHAQLAAAAGAAESTLGGLEQVKMRSFAELYAAVKSCWVGSCNVAVPRTMCDGCGAAAATCSLALWFSGCVDGSAAATRLGAMSARSCRLAALLPLLRTPRSAAAAPAASSGSHLNSSICDAAAVAAVIAMSYGADPAPSVRVAGASWRSCKIEGCAE